MDKKIVSFVKFAKLMVKIRSIPRGKIKNKWLAQIALAFLILQLPPCDNWGDYGQDVALETRFQRFDQAFFETDTARFQKELAGLKERFPVFFLNDGTDKFWYQQRTDPRQLKLYNAVQEELGALQAENERLNQAMKRYYYHFGTRDTLQVYGYISNLDFDYPVLYADSLLFVGLDLYLGKDAPYYRTMPRYLAYKRVPRFLVRDVMATLAREEAPDLAADPTLLEAMIHHGKRYYLLQELMPELSEADLLQYSPSKLDYAREHETDMWNFFIEQEMLYRRGNRVLRRFIEVAPFSKFRTKRDRKTPGRIGHWYGYKIVTAYMDQHPETPMDQLLRLDAREIFRKGGYKP